MNFIPTDKHRFISRWGLSVLAGFSACMGLLGAQSTLSHWDTLSQSQTTTRVAREFTQANTERRTQEHLAEIERQAQISDAYNRANILDNTCGTSLSRFRYNPGTVDDDLIRWGINPGAPVFNPNPGRWYPIYDESGVLVAAIRDGSIITRDSEPAMSAGAMCTFGELK